MSRIATKCPVKTKRKLPWRSCRFLFFNVGSRLTVVVSLRNRVNRTLYYLYFKGEGTLRDAY